MKIKPANAQPGAVNMTRRGFYVRDTRYGVVAQPWPPKRGKAKTPYDLYKQLEFGMIARWAANPFQLDWETAVEMVKGTSYVPRDFLMGNAYGRNYEIQQPDGTVWQNGRDLTNNPQYTLDLVTEAHGSMLWRSPIGWVGLPPDDNGKVLTMVNQAPVWQTPAGGGGGGGGVWSLLYSGTITSGISAVVFPNITSHNVIVIAEGMTMTAAGVRRVQCSIDNGSTFFTASGDYDAISSGGNTTVRSGIAEAGDNTTASRNIIATLSNLQVPNTRKFATRMGGETVRLTASQDPVNCIRLATSTSTFTGGTYQILGM